MSANERTTDTDPSLTEPEYETAADWPGWTDADRWTTNEPVPFEPDAADSEWWAQEPARFEAVDREWTATDQGIVDAWLEMND